MDGGYNPGQVSRSRAAPISRPDTWTAPPGDAIGNADKAFYEMGVIVEILLDMASADIDGSRPIQGPSVAFLAKQLRGALDLIDPALATLR